MIVGILPKVSNAEILLDNLSEADFELSDVSIIMKDVKQRNAIAQDGGPLKGADLSNVFDQLVRAGISVEEARLYRDAVAQGQVLIAMIVPSEAQKAAIEMLQDHSAEHIKE